MPPLQDSPTTDSVIASPYSAESLERKLQNKLTLEESLEFMDQPHKLHLQAVLKTAEKQKAVIKKLGEQLVELTRQTRMRR